MTAAVAIKPLAVWDARTSGWHGWPHWREAEQWAHDQGLIDFDRGERSATYRVEIWLVDAPFARCFRYRCHADGRLIDGHPAPEKPEDVPLAELPPEHLLGPKAGDY